MEPNTLLVNISSARGLYLKNHNTLDAVASITLKGKGTTKSRVVTEVVNCETDCKWDENCEFKINEKSTHLDIAVNHKTKLGGNDLIGKVEIPLDQAKRLGGHTWFPLKKRKDDDKYRGEVQMQFAFHYEKPTLSISNSALNELGKESFADKMKRKMQKLSGGGKMKQAEDTMSVASGVSAFSVKSTRSHRFMHKINKTFGGLHKSSTLPNHGASFDATSQDDSFDSSSHYLAPPGSVTRPSSFGSGLNFREEANDVRPLSVHAANMSGISNCSTAGPISPSVSTAESFHRANSIRSVASSGFGSSKQPLHLKLDNGAGSHDLLAELDSLRLELQVKDSRLKDMHDYMDNLISRVMERCPDLLAAPLGPPKTPRKRYF